MTAETRESDLRATFRANLVLIRHVVEECSSEVLAKEIHRELFKVWESNRKRFGLPVRERVE